jgi:hypothetical protein
MPNLTYRLVKGNELTYDELDNNFVELNYRTQRGWNDLVQEVAIKAGVDSPTLSNFRDGIVAYQFDPDLVQSCFANFHFKHDYIPGTMVYPHVHWSTNTASTGVVRWGVEYTLARRWESTGNRTFGPTQIIYIDANVATPSQYMHMVNEMVDGAGVDGTDLETDAVMLCRFFRDAAHPNDTYPDPVFLLTVDIHYEASHMVTPTRFPPFY